MRGPGIIAVLLLTAALSMACGRRAPPLGSASSAGSTVRVIRVVDGDTLHVRYEGRDERLRLIGVDTPEVPWYGGDPECFGVEAGLYTKQRLSGRSVGVTFDVDRRDPYGRLLAYVYLGREFFNLTLVERGFARAEAVRPDTRFAGAFEEAESKAAAAGLGLWSACPT